MGISINEIRKDQMLFKILKQNEIEKILIQQFGKKSLRPINDTDRPFEVSELKDFSSHPNVHIGNHTHNPSHCTIGMNTQLLAP